MAEGNVQTGVAPTAGRSFRYTGPDRRIGGFMQGNFRSGGTNAGVNYTRRTIRTGNNRRSTLDLREEAARTPFRSSRFSNRIQKASDWTAAFVGVPILGKLLGLDKYLYSNEQTTPVGTSTTSTIPSAESWTLYNKYVDPTTKKLKKPLEQHTDEEL